MSNMVKLTINEQAVEAPAGMLLIADGFTSPGALTNCS